MNTKAIAILVSAIAIGAIGLAFSTGAFSPQQTATSSCDSENSNLLSGNFTTSQSTTYTYKVQVHNGQSQEVRLTSYVLGTQSFKINLTIAPGRNGTFTTAPDTSSETWIPVKTSCGNQFMTMSAQSETYTEDITPGSTIIQGPTQVEAQLLNNGTGTATLTAYYVTDSSGNEYALTNWSGPSIAPNGVATTTFSIGSSCSQCTLQGSAFTFTSGSQYTVRVVTERGNVFTFAVTHQNHYSITLYAGIGNVAQ